VEAALLAQAGIRGPQMFGRKNILDTFSSGRSDEKVKLLIETMEKGGSVLQTGFKRYPACKFLQTAIDAAMELRAAGVTADDIGEITLSVAPSTAPLIDDAGDLTHNAQLVLAAALADGHVSSEQYATIRSNRRIMDLSRKVRVVADRQLEKYYPEAMPASLELRLNNGEKMSTFVEYAKGDPAKPLSTAELISKFDTLAGGHPGAGTIVESINSLGAAGETKHLLEMLCHR
jgi:2-methylcitrate dehydratase PrpD